MNKTNLLSRIIQTTSITLVLTIGCMVSSVKAATLTGTISPLSGNLDWLEGNNSKWEGIYTYRLMYEWNDVTMMGTVTITALSSPDNDKYKDWNGEYPITSFDNSTDPPTIKFKGERFNRSSGTSGGGTMDGTIKNGQLTYTWTTPRGFTFKSTPIPEPSQIIGLFGLGILGTASTLKRK